MRTLNDWRLRSARRRAALALSVCAVAACSNVTDSLLEAEDPDLIPPGATESAEGAFGLANGALDAFRNITSGSESTWLFGGLLGDEWSTSSTFPQNDQTDQRRIEENNSQIRAMLYRLYRGRIRPSEAITALNKYSPSSRPLIAEMYFAKGFAELQLAQDFCNGIPISELVDGVPVPGGPETVDQVFQRATATFDSALALANGTDAASVRIRNAAAIGKGRALLGRGQIAAAGAAVTGIPTSFAYQHTFSLTTGSNTLWAQGLSARRYSVGDSLEGNARNIVVRNALPFVSARDPRLPVTIPAGINGQDGLTRARTTTLYGQLTPTDVANGIDARMIEAEAALQAGDVTRFLAIHNALRANPPKLGEVQPTPMAPLADPGTPEKRISLHFQEKAFWTFSRGQRLGDMRRLVRQYNRPANTVFPEGIHYKGGDYGVDVNFPIHVDEVGNNPKFSGCIDRKA